MKKMKRRSNIKFSVVALSVAALMSGMGMSAMANAETVGAASTTFTTTINVTSDNTCTLTVTPPADTSFSASWEGTTAVEPTTSTMTNTTADTAPHYIKVTAAGGATCSLNNIKLVTTTPGTVINKRPAAAFGVSGGFWTYGPALADAKFYTDAAYTTQGTGTISLKAASGSVFTIGNTVTDPAGFKNDSGSLGDNISLTDGYGNRPLPSLMLTDAITGTADGVVSFTSSKPTEVYKSAEFGIGVALSVDPVNAEGVIDRMVAANNDVVNLPFTVTVTEA